MPFTNPWSNIIPAGSDPANTADDEIRQLRLDIDERQDTIVGDWSADPLFSLTDIRKVIHWSEGTFVRVGGSGFWVAGGFLGTLQVESDNVANSIRWDIPLRLPVGATLTLVESKVFRGNAGAFLSQDVRKIVDPGAFGTPTDLLQNQVVSAVVTGWHVLASPVLSVGPLVIDESIYVQYLLTPNAASTDVGFLQTYYEYTSPFALAGSVG